MKNNKPRRARVYVGNIRHSWVTALVAAGAVLVLVGGTAWLFRSVGSDTPVATTAVVGQSSVGDSPENPTPVGERMLVGGWNLRVVGSTPSGSELFGVKVTAGNYRDGSTTIASGVSLSARTETGETLAPVRAGCPDVLSVDQAIASDATLEGFVCFRVDPVSVAGLLLVAEAVDSPTPHRVYMATIEPGHDSGTVEFGPDELVAELQHQGLDAVVVDSPYARIGYMQRAIEVRILCIGDHEASLFVYETSALAQSDAATIRPDGNPENVTIDLIYGRLMWWARGRVIVNYNLAHPIIWASLTTVMGSPLSPDGTSFAPPPDPPPVSESCSR